MPTPTATQTSAQDLSLADQFASLTGEQVYDSIMSRIEPELVLTNLEELDAPYADETEDERSLRYERYGKAFVKYREAYTAWIQSLSSAVSAYKKAVMRASEDVNKADEDSALESITSQIQIA